MTKTVLITGASSGIGKELASHFARDKYNLVLVARNRERLDQVASELKQKHQIEVWTIAKDLSNPAAPTEIYNEIKTKNLTIDVLVNNAGFGNLGPFVETNLSDEQEMITVNITSLTTLTKLFLTEMKAKGKGKILNVASTAAFEPGPNMAVYFATKAYVLSFSEALAEELRGTGIHVSALCPGPTKTGFQERAFKDLNPFAGYMDAKTVARVAYTGLNRGKVIIIPGFQNKFLVELVRFTPRAWVRRIMKKLMA